MPKNIVICSDGTGNSAGKERGTNVYKLYEATDLQARNGLPQIAIYDDGVGTEKLKIPRMLGGAFGWGLSRNVRQLYAALARAYELGDHIFLFGFSRGAFTVRTLAGLIDDCGILRQDKLPSDQALQKKAKQAYRVHRRKYQTALQRMWHKVVGHRIKTQGTDEFRAKWSVKHPRLAPAGRVPIEFVGVWDTVDAVGLPWDRLADPINALLYRFTFPNVKLSPRVNKACHALAIDDERHTFHPVVWDERKEDTDRIEQVWFAGVHSNVGGGYPRQGMSLVSLDWMMAKAEAAGLRFVAGDKDRFEDHRNVDDKLYDSRSGLATAYRYKPRSMLDQPWRSNAKPKVHISALWRIANGTEGYAPGNIPSDIQVVGNGSNSESLYVVDAMRRLEEEIARDRAGTSLLEAVSKYVSMRRYAHHMLLVLVAALGYLTVHAGLETPPESNVPGFLSPFVRVIEVLGELKSPAGLMQLGKTMLLQPWLPLLLVAAFVGGLWARKHMERSFSKFWRLRQHTLREIFRALDNGKPTPLH